MRGRDFNIIACERWFCIRFFLVVDSKIVFPYRHHGSGRAAVGLSEIFILRSPFRARPFFFLFEHTPGRTEMNSALSCPNVGRKIRTGFVIQPLSVASAVVFYEKITYSTLIFTKIPTLKTSNNTSQPGR